MEYQDRKCEHIDSGAKGIIKNQLKATDEYPEQWGIYWTEKANCLNFANHYYWNDKSKIKILAL